MDYVEIKCQLDATDLLHLVGILFPHNKDDARSKSLQIPDYVLIQLILLMMSIGLLETCREVK